MLAAIETPADLPCIACEKLGWGMVAMSAPLILVIAAATSFFFCTMYPTTTTSSIDLSFPTSKTFNEVDDPTTTSLDSLSRKENTRVVALDGKRMENIPSVLVTVPVLAPLINTDTELKGLPF